MNIADLPQPFGFYRVITGGDDLHFGYWDDPTSALTLPEAQKALTRLLLDRFPPPPARVLDIGCGLGVMAERLHHMGYEVVAISPDAALVQAAAQAHPGPTYLPYGFLEPHSLLEETATFDVLLLQESLQYLADLTAVFIRAKRLLTAQGLMIFCDEVSYNPGTRDTSAVHLAAEIEAAFSHEGFFVRHHRKLGAGVAPTCQQVVAGFQAHHERIVELFGPQIDNEVNRFCAGWQTQADWYQQQLFGYELWVLQPSDYEIRGYISGDEYAILTAFQTAFGVSRTLQHWHWKFLQDPFGGPYLATIWQAEQLAAHYAAYPVPTWLNGRSVLTMQVGDTLTLPEWRGIGRGATSLLARSVRFFHRQYCEQRIPFFYGFNTGKIQTLGQRFLNYQPIAPVYEYHLTDPELQILKQTPRWANWVKGYTVACVTTADEWADTLFNQARQHYGYLVERNSTYLRWRYQQHPDLSYHFFVVKHWQQPVGWWVGRVQDNTLFLVDALFYQQTPAALRAGLIAALKFYQQCGQPVTQISGWFAQTPTWWPPLLTALGFTAKRQHQALDFCVTIFDSSQVTPEQLAEQFYFTAGDSDLF